MSVAGVVLAAGPSRRFASVDSPSMPSLKQLLDFGGETLVRRATRTALSSKLARVIVVVGCEAAAVRDQISDLPVEIVENPDWPEGQSTSVRAGLHVVESGVDAALFLPCDQPFLDAHTIDRLVEARASYRKAIVIPSFEGRRGAPVLFGSELFGELETIEGDEGGRQLFALHADSLAIVDLEDALPLEDIDTPEDYDALLERLG